MTENSSDRRPPVQFTPRLIFGMGLLIVGMIWLFDNLGLIDADGFWNYWPLILVAVGVSKLTEVGRTGGWLSSFAWIAVGLWWTAYNLEFVDIHVFDLWPVIFIVGGIVIVRRALMPESYNSNRSTSRSRRRSRVRVAVGSLDEETTKEVVDAAKEVAEEIRKGVHEATDEIRRGFNGEKQPRNSVGGVFGGNSTSDDHSATGWAVCCGVKRRVSDQQFRGGDFTAIMGGVEVDLSRADIDDDEAIIEVLAFWGGIDIVVPQNWTVIPQVTPILGGFVDETDPVDPDPTKRLIIRGLAMMGGVHVSN